MTTPPDVWNPAQYGEFAAERAPPVQDQLAVQMPANFDHPSHALALEVAGEEPFRSALGDDAASDGAVAVLPPERYAELLDELGFAEQDVRLQVYGHELASSGAVVEWTK